jgi:hypothetical protein
MDLILTQKAARWLQRRDEFKDAFTNDLLVIMGK